MPEGFTSEGLSPNSLYRVLISRPFGGIFFTPHFLSRLKTAGCEYKKKKMLIFIRKL